MRLNAVVISSFLPCLVPAPVDCSTVPPNLRCQARSRANVSFNIFDSLAKRLLPVIYVDVTLNSTDSLPASIQEECVGVRVRAASRGPSGKMSNRGVDRTEADLRDDAHVSIDMEREAAGRDMSAKEPVYHWPVGTRRTSAFESSCEACGLTLCSMPCDRVNSSGFTADGKVGDPPVTSVAGFPLSHWYLRRKRAAIDGSWVSPRKRPRDAARLGTGRGRSIMLVGAAVAARRTLTWVRIDCLYFSI